MSSKKVQKDSYFNLPCNGEKIGKSAWSRHLESCPYCSKEFNELLNGTKYDNLIEEFLESEENPITDFSVKFSKYPGLFPIYGKKISDTVLDTILTKKSHLIPDSWNYECVCGIRLPNGAVFSAHIRKCTKFLELRQMITEKYFDSDHLKSNLEIKRKPIRVYLDEIFDLENITVQTVQNSLYSYFLRYVDKLVKEGKLKYEKLTTKDIMNNEYCKQRVKQGVISKYGVDNVSKLEWVKQKKEESYRKHFGVPHHMKLKSQKEKVKETVRKRYNVDNVSQAEFVKKKKEETFLKNYGMRNIFCNNEYIKQKYFQKYGVFNPSQDVEIMYKKLSKVVSNSDWYGKRVTVHGYDIVVLSDNETKIFDVLLNPVNFSILKCISDELFFHVNSVVFKNDRKVYVPDFVVYANTYTPYFSIELKSGIDLDIQYVSNILDIVKLYVEHFCILCCDSESYKYVLYYFNTRHSTCKIFYSWNLLNKNLILNKVPESYKILDVTQTYDTLFDLVPKLYNSLIRKYNPTNSPKEDTNNA